MLRKRRYGATLLALLLSLCLSRSVAEASAFQVKELANGMDVITWESRKVPLVTIVLTVKAGAFTETPDISGLTHLWEHMFFKGNASIPDQEAFRERIRDLGIVYNGDTSAEMVRYYFTLPSAFLEEGLDFMYHAIATPLIDEGELERERKVVLDEYDRNASQTGFELYRARQDAIYGSLSYRRNPLGERPIIEGATRDQLVRIKDEVFVPQNSALLIAGDVSTADVLKKVETIFSRWQNPTGWKAQVPPAFPAFPKQGIEIVKIHPQARHVSVSATFEGPKARLQPKDAYIADVLIGLVNHSLSPFIKRYMDSGLTFGASFSYATQSQAGELGISAFVSATQYSKFREELSKETARWAEKDAFSQEMLEDVRRSLVVQRAFEENRPSEYVKSLAYWWAITDLPFYDQYISELQKVTLEEVRGFVERYLLDKKPVVAVLLSPLDADKLQLKETSAKSERSQP
jgi:zinc protease